MELDLMFLKKTPPHSLEAERAVLGGILVQKENLNVVLSTISPDDFYKDAHRRIIEGIIVLVDKGLPVDLLSLSRRAPDGAGSWRRPAAPPIFRASSTASPGTSTSSTTPRSSRRRPSSGG